MGFSTQNEEKCREVVDISSNGSTSAQFLPLHSAGHLTVLRESPTSLPLFLTLTSQSLANGRILGSVVRYTRFYSRPGRFLTNLRYVL